MKQALFEKSHAALWRALEQTLEELEQTRKRPSPGALGVFVDQYRELVRQHALAEERCYSAGLIDRLQSLLARCHRQLYRRREFLPGQVVHFLLVGFPTAVRRHARYFLLASMLFYLPALAIGVWTYFHSDAIYTLLDAAAVSNLEFAYDPATEHPGRGEGRQSSTNIEMFGFYIYNNTSIGFRSYASGLAFGIGSVIITLYNGLVIGAAAGHLIGLGFQQTFWPFVSGHAAFELTAICISAAGGLMLGSALLFPGYHRRVDALRAAAIRSVPLVAGSALFFFIAAFIEAFWSPSGTSSLVKYLVAGSLWLLVFSYLALSGRSHRGT